MLQSTTEAHRMAKYKDIHMQNEYENLCCCSKNYAGLRLVNRHRKTFPQEKAIKSENKVLDLLLFKFMVEMYSRV